MRMTGYRAVSPPERQLDGMGEGRLLAVSGNASSPTTG